MKKTKSYVSAFYDKKYTKYKHPDPETWLEFLYHRLKKYELHRNSAAVLLLNPVEKLLDVGAGFGELLSEAYQAQKATKLYGIDISDTVVKHCQKELKKKKIAASITVQSIDKKTTFRANSFDAITMIAVFEHIFDPHAVLSEIHRILKPGGQLIIEVPNAVFLPRRVSFLWGTVPKTSDEPLYQDGHLQFFSHDTLAKLLNQYNFKIEVAQCSGIFWKIRSLWPQLLGANIVVKAVKK